MISKKEQLQQFKLYAVTDVKGTGQDLLARAEAAYRGGADIVQLRAKSMADAEFLAMAQKLSAMAAAQRKLFFVNDRVEIALRAGADGVHLGQEDMPVAEARKLAAGRPDFLIGKSTHSLPQALAAQVEGADYIGVGPVFSTPTKPGREPVGLTLVRDVSRSALVIPFVAIGGIDLTNLQQVLDAGSVRVACVRAIFDQEDVFHATSELRKQLEKFSHAAA